MCVGLMRHHGGLLADPNVFDGFESIHKNNTPVPIRTSILLGQLLGNDMVVAAELEENSKYWHARDFRKLFDPRNVCRVDGQKT